MANSYVTMKNIARKALPILVDNLVFPNLVYKDYSGDFMGKGDTVQVKKPPIFEAAEFSSSISVQDSETTAVDVKLDTIADVSVEITSKDLATEDSQFFQNVLPSMAVAIAEKINSDGLELAKDIPYYSGTAGTTPDALEDFSDIRKALNSRKVPMGMRNAVWNVDADAKFTQLDSLVEVDKAGSNKALREGQIGRVFALDNYYSQSVYEHTAGTFTAVASPLTAGAVAVGDTSIDLDGGSGTETILAGDIFTISDQQFVATADATASSGAVTVQVYPAATAIIADNTAVVFPDKTALGSVRNLGFHQNAFAWVTRPLPAPSDAKSYTTSYNGITLRVTQSYDIDSKKETLSMDVLYGYKTLYPELAHIQLG